MDTEALARFPLENPNPVLRLALDGRIEFANPSAEVAFEQWQGSAPAALVEQFATLASSPQGRELLVLVGSSEYRFRLVRPPEAPYVYAYATDQTELAVERRRTERLARFPEEIPDPVIRLDAAGRVTYANPAAVPVLVELNLDLGDGAPTLLLRGGSLEFADGRLMVLSAHPGPDGSFTWVHARDATAERRARVAEAKDAAKSAFLSQMSHELRTPLTAILGYSELVQEELASVGAEKLAPDLERIARSARYLLDLVTAVLDLSKVEAGRVELCRGPVDLAELAREVVASLAPLARRAGDRLEVDAPDLAPVVTDERLVRQILVNLVGNAIKFTDDGRVSVSVRLEPGVARLVVDDTGLGMTSDEAVRVFEPFVQADTSSTRRFGGTGLGLTLSRHYAGLLGGRLDLVSEPGKGSRFTLVLPR